jgi:hypothetical protein
MKHVVLQYMVNPKKKWKQVIRRKGIWLLLLRKLNASLSPAFYYFDLNYSERTLLQDPKTNIQK